jgi:hypothetical protein
MSWKSHEQWRWGGGRHPLATPRHLKAATLKVKSSMISTGVLRARRLKKLRDVRGLERRHEERPP